MIEGVITQNGREVLMMGKYVAICWSGQFAQAFIEDRDGKKHQVREWQRRRAGRHGKAYAPYIDFVWLREYGDGETWEDEDGPIAGGMAVNVARELAKELSKAVAYIEALE